jgi:hypothetical protein
LKFSENSLHQKSKVFCFRERASSGFLQRRVRQLENENAVLKLDIGQLKAITIVLKGKEDQIVGEFLRKLGKSVNHLQIDIYMYTKGCCAPNHALQMHLHLQKSHIHQPNTNAFSHMMIQEHHTVALDSLYCLMHGILLYT